MYTIGGAYGVSYSLKPFKICFQVQFSEVLSSNNLVKVNDAAK